MDWKAKLLAGLRWVKDSVVYYANIVIDPPPAAIKWYILATLVAAIGGGVILAPWFAPKAPAPVYSLASPPAGIAVSFPKRHPSKELAELKLLKPQPPAATVKAADAKPKKRPAKRRETVCSWPFC